MAMNCDDDFDWTREELNTLKEAFKDKKFIQMFSEYAEEVTDPENVKKYESDVIAYERQHGSEAKFIHPEGGYVLKTSVAGERKAFINICANSNVEKPSFQREVIDGKTGARWRLPHFLTPPRDDFDKSQRRCVVYDVIFHPDTIKLSKNEQFRKMINDIAVEEIENKFGVTLDKNNIRFPKMKYKGTPVATITRKKLEIKDSTVDVNEDGLDDELKELLKPPSKSYNCNKSSNRRNEKNIAQNNSDKNENNATWSIPKYTVKYRNHVDFQDYTNMPHQTVNTRPQEIVVDIDLPLLNSASHLNLDISEKNMVLVSEKKGANYRLDLSFAYPIDEKEGKAQFDKSKRTLTVTLKVLPANNSDMVEDNTQTFLNNETSSLYLNNLQHSVDNEKEFSDTSETATGIETSDILLNCSEERPNVVLNNISGRTDESLIILPTFPNAPDELDSELSELMEKMDEQLHIKESENMICEVATENNNSNIGHSSIEGDKNLDALLEETEHKCEMHDSSKNIPPISEVAYFPNFSFHQTSEVVVFLIEEKNIDPSSLKVCICECRTSCWITFFTLGTGFVPFCYCLFLNFGSYLIAEGANVNTDLNENNLIIHLTKDCNNSFAWTEFEAGINDKSLQKYEFLCEENIMKAIQELKTETEVTLNGENLTNEHVHVEDVSEEQVIFDINLKKGHSLEHPLENVSENVKEEMTECTLENVPGNIEKEVTEYTLENVSENIDEEITECSLENVSEAIEEITEVAQHSSSVERNQNDFQLPQEESLCSNDEFKTILPSVSKVRTSSGSSEDQSPTQKRPGILKYARYWRTMSESSDDMFWSSMDNEATPVGSLDSLRERPKKCVRFNDQVAKNVFRANSSILGQRRKNQRKARNRKKSHNKGNSDGTTETSEEASDCNSASESTPEISHTDTWSQNLYSKQQCKSIDADMDYSSENVYSNNAVYHNIGMLNNEINKTHSMNTNMYNKHLSTALNFPPEDKHSHTTFDIRDGTVEIQQNAKVIGPGESKMREPPFTIMQQPQQILSRQQQPLNLQQSGQSKDSHPYSKNIKRANMNSIKGSENKASRNNRTTFQRQDNSQGETKQKGRRRRRWRNKNHTKPAPITSDSQSQEPSYSILKSPYNFSDPEKLQNCEKRKLSEYSEDENPNSTITENVNDVTVDEIHEKSTNADYFWQCKNNADDAQYRTNCIVDFTNELMFQLD